MKNFWSSSGLAQLHRNAQGWLAPGDDYLRLFLHRPELAVVSESCIAERRLHEALLAVPSRPVAAQELQALTDADARESYGFFLRFRDALLAAGTLEAYYMRLFPRDGAGQVNIPPLFVDLMAQAITHNLLDGVTDAYEMRAGELLFRSQRITLQGGQLLSADRELLDRLHGASGLGDIGRFLAEAKAPLRPVELQVLSDTNAPDYFRPGRPQAFLLDLTHEVSHDLSHGLVFRMTRARSGLKALAIVLEKWIRHFLGVSATIRPVQKIDDPAWRWHVGLDSESTALLNDLYDGRQVEPERTQRLLSLFRLEFNDPGEMRPDVAGKPVYLAAMMNAEGIFRLKPQNLLVNLPLRTDV